MAGELERCGTNCDDIGTHSMRKGAATYCSSGSTACPPAIAVHLRAGWALGGVQDRYLRHDSAGDMFVGRTVSGLPILDADFATLPPRFHGGREQVEIAKRIGFRQLPRSASLIGEFALASIVYHYEYLKENLPGNHPIFQSPLMRDEQMMQVLKGFIKFGPPNGDDNISATGIPPHVVLLSEFRSLKAAFEKQQVDQQNVVNEVVAGVRLALEDAVDIRNTPNSNQIATTVIDCLHREGYVRQRPDEDENYAPGVAPVATTVHQTSNNFSLYTWGGGFHAFPEDVALPEGTTEQAWVFWCCGDPARSLPPFRRLKSVDLREKKHKKRLSDLKFLMGLVEERASALNIDTRTLTTTEEAVEVFRRCEDVLEMPDETPNARKRRSNQLVWQTVTSIMRKRLKSVGHR
ncbi:hypothetical protein AM587_10002055 [Phytophthora nicotianae]|nr:hypothetical protein AM587_10002055 [Phytophthora nicotianae]